MAKLSKGQIISLQKRLQGVSISVFSEIEPLVIHETKSFRIVVYFTRSCLQPLGANYVERGSNALPTFKVRDGSKEYMISVRIENPCLTFERVHYNSCPLQEPTRYSFLLNIVGVKDGYYPEVICNSIIDFCGYYYFGERYRVN